ncbi:MAG: regulatory iron-sulfur-containing complex subunit RicT, partial [Eubacteriales bacterium]|nr:regulatory iron-sulfur-containing complex subunit RicT [Eubacteriales bacterium]
HCGQELCCKRLGGEFNPVTIKMAKEQGLSLNPQKISGTCGRLMCCLRYEQDFYEQMLKKVPKVGSEVITPDGPGVVSEIFVIREKVRVRIRTADDSFDVREFNIDDVYRPGRQPPKKAEPQ